MYRLADNVTAFNLFISKIKSSYPLLCYCGNVEDKAVAECKLGSGEDLLYSNPVSFPPDSFTAQMCPFRTVAKKEGDF